tara:strand:+ start:273 stop:878 length:606 start_codon:yes stop_codon:yes gene_type:complete
MGINKILFFIFIVIIVNVDARPVSWTQGSTLMAYSNNLKNSIYYHFSPTYKFSLGLEMVEDKVFDNSYAYFRFTRLLNRKNMQNSQRNLYFRSGVSSKQWASYFFGLQGDWETRRLFAGFNVNLIESGNRDYFNQSYQVGIAPYLGEFGDLHTWIMVKTKRNSVADEWSTFPVIRLFKGDVMLELGYNGETSWDTHLMYRF